MVWVFKPAFYLVSIRPYPRYPVLTAFPSLVSASALAGMFASVKLQSRLDAEKGAPHAKQALQHGRSSPLTIEPPIANGFGRTGPIDFDRVLQTVGFPMEYERKGVDLIVTQRGEPRVDGARKA